MKQLRSVIRQLIESSYEYSGLFHVSDNPNLTINKEYSPKQGQLGKGFYLTNNPDVWNEGNIGDRPFVYQVENPESLNIASPEIYPSRKQLVKFGVENGFYKMGIVTKPNGEKVKELDGSDMVRPIETDKYRIHATYSDPMTGSSSDFLAHEYLKQLGYDGLSPEYSRDGHQIIIWNYDKIKLKRIK
jgi:hypothetical protein